MKDDLKSLLLMQDVDSRMDRVTAEMDEIPREKLIHERELESQKADFESEKKKLEKVKEESAECVAEKKATQERLTEFNAKLLQIKTNEAYTAMLNQIEYTKNKVSECDLRIIEKMYEEEEVEKNLEDAGKIWERNRKRSEKRQDILEGQLEVLKENMEELIAEREEIAAGINKRLLDKYEQLRATGRGLVVVGLQGGACGGCLTNIPPQKAVEINQGVTYICPICGRFVIWKDDSSMAGTK